MSTVHIESKKGEIANIVLMPGDPKRAEYIAKNYLNDYILINDVRGMTAYTGHYCGKLVTIFPSGMGNPSMGIYSYELFKYYDVDYIIRIGSMGGYNENLDLNDLILVDKSFSNSSYGLVLDNYELNYIDSSDFLNTKISLVAQEKKFNIKKGNIFCTDVFYEQNNNYHEKEKAYDVLGVEMETFSLFNNARLFNKNASAILTVSDLFFDERMLDSNSREKKLNEMIKLALETIKNL